MKWFSSNSSSFHIINSDYKLGIIKRYSYLVFNLINNFFQSRSTNSYKMFQLYNYNYLEISQSIELSGSISPSRFLCNKFWDNLNITAIKKLLGHEINAIEIGCGSGIYGQKLIQKDKSVRYLGVDIAIPGVWPQIGNATFIQASYDDVDKLLENSNFLFTQSALEHFENDLSFFRKIGIAAKKTGTPLLQVHLFPSSNCLKLYLWHGIRQYNSRTIKRLIKAANPDMQPILICLGGKNSNKLHFRSITIPNILRKFNSSYPKNLVTPLALASSIKLDSETKNHKSVSFYVLIFQHNLGKEINLNELLYN
jgi:hypothetical protein